MKKSFSYLLACTLAWIICAGCENNNNVTPYAVSDIVGKWKLTYDGDKSLTTNKRCVYTISSDSTVTASIAFEPSKIQMGLFVYKQKGTYTLQNNILTMTFGKAPEQAAGQVVEQGQGKGPGERKIFDKQFEVTFADKTTLVLKAIESENSDTASHSSKKPTPPNACKYTKVNVDYAAAILGTWEGVTLEGESEYGDEHHRWEYKSDSTYVYYNKVNNEWVPSSNTSNQYFVDGDWMATMWTDSIGTKNYEWWDIDTCNDTEMIWTAIRMKADSTQYSAKFTMKKVQAGK